MFGMGIGNQVAMGTMLNMSNQMDRYYGGLGNQAITNTNNWYGTGIGYSADFPTGMGYGFGPLTNPYPAAQESMNRLGSEQSWDYAQWGNQALNTVSALYGTQLPMVADHPFGQGLGYGNPTPTMGYTGMNSISNNFMGYPTQYGVAASPTLGIGQRMNPYSTATQQYNVSNAQNNINPFFNLGSYTMPPVFANFQYGMTM